MVKKKMTGRLLAVLLIAAMIVSSVTIISFGASGSKKMTDYSQVYVKGKYAYCVADKGIYRVNLNNEHVKRISKKRSADEGNYLSFKLYKGYIYYTGYGTATRPLCRVTTSGKNFKKLGNVFDFAINKGTIYYTTFSSKEGTEVNKQMTIKGKNKRRSRYHPKVKTKASNKKGYKVKEIVEKQYDTETDDGTVWHTKIIGDYLITPQGKKIRLCGHGEEYSE